MHALQLKQVMNEKSTLLELTEIIFGEFLLQVFAILPRYCKLKIKEMPRSLFYVIPRYVTMDYEKRYKFLLLTQCGEIRAFEDQANYM